MDDRYLSISPSSLQRRIGGSQSPTVVDVRRPAAYEKAGRVIATARWRDHRGAADWAAELPVGSPVVVYCVHGHEVSQSAAALLRACGRQAFFLEGGIEAFAAAGGVTLDKGGLPTGALAGGSRWAIDATAAVDRLACRWLIRRFVDLQALILDVAPERLEAVAQEAEAVVCNPGPAAAEGSRFAALLERFDIRDATLRELGELLDDAGAGLRAVCAGLTAAAADGDGDLIVFDALYAGLRRGHS